MLEFTSEFADVEYIEADGKVLLTWKKEARFDNYRKPTTAALELLRKYGCDFVIDARNGFEDDKADVEWGFSWLLPEMAKTGCKNVWLIMNEVRMHLEFFEKEDNGLYSRSSDSFSEMAYSEAELEKALSDAGFEVIARYGDDTDLPPAPDSQRIVYVARCLVNGQTT